jgi:hypothetical protein
MNSKELEALVIKQGETIAALQEALDKTVDQGQFEQLQESLQLLDHAFQEHRALVLEGLGEINQLITKLQNWIGADEDDGPFYPEFKALTARTEKLETLVMARNASAATKRNMTDEDALRVMTGDLKDLAHKEAAEKAGLTYAQVYSCRLEFTFKHVHKTLRDAATRDAPWVNPWSK